MSKKLSIITVCFNIKDEIERTCKSIINQTWQDFEWIVVDGGSTDGTVEILNKYKKHMTVLISEPDKGIYNAMNKGIKLAKGKYLNFMNGGDYFYADDVLEKIFATKDYDSDILYGDYNILEDSAEAHIYKFSDNIDAEFFIDNIINHQSTFIKRELFKKYGLYNENYKIVSDWEKWIVYALNGCRFEHLHIVVANFMYNGIGSIMTPLHINERLSIYKKYYKRQKTFYLFNFIPILRLEHTYK